MCKEGPVNRVRARALTSFFLIICLATLGVHAAKPASVKLAWDPSVTPGVTGYNIYYGTNSHNYTASIPAGNATSVTISSLVVGTTYYFAATAYDSFGIESDFSVETNYVPISTGNTPPTISI